MAFNQHIGVFQTEADFQEAISRNILVSPWVAYIVTPEDGKTNIRLPEGIKVENSDGNTNVFEEIKNLLPVMCTEDEYDILMEKKEGWVTDPRKKEDSAWVQFDPNVYYYTYDPTELD